LNSIKRKVSHANFENNIKLYAKHIIFVLIFKYQSKKKYFNPSIKNFRMKTPMIKKMSIIASLAIIVLLGVGCQKTVEEKVALAPAPAGIDGSGRITQDVEWPDVNPDPLKVDYEIAVNAVIEDNVMVRIAPGVVIKFTGVNSGITVTNGALVAVGTEAKPICLDGSVESRGSWKGIRINTNNPANELKYCKVRYAGSDGEGAVQVRGGLNGTYTAFCRISLCEISNSSSYGLYLDKNSNVVFAQNMVTSNSNAPVRMTTLQLGKLDAASNYSNNTFGHIEVSGEGILEESVIVPKLIVPYQITNGKIEVNNGYLGISAGVEMRFKLNTSIEMKSTGVGTISAIGTATNRITFRGVQAGRGGWNGIAIFGNSTSNAFEYCTIDGGGQNSMGALTDPNNAGIGRANIVVGNVIGNFPHASFINCTISGSAGFGIWKGGSAAGMNIQAGTLNNNVETVNTFTNNFQPFPIGQ
jgi:hypothetical protein